jgi:polyketide synthase 12
MDRPVVTWGTPPAERADAARNRQRLLATAREMIAELGVDAMTMDALAERSGLGKGTVFRRFGTRAGIFQALLDDGERALQEQVLSGPPPLGPGAGPLERLIAYGRARVGFLIEHRDTAALDGPLLLYMSAADPADARQVEQRLAQSWEALVRRVCRP